VTRIVALHPSAEDDVEQARRWYAERSPIAAHAFLMELEHSIEAVSQSPERWQQYLAGTRRCPFPRFPFSVIYRVEANALTVIAVSHQRRKPGHWLSRGEKQV
jgi:plasmid stabilization system protein ParE